MIRIILYSALIISFTQLCISRPFRVNQIPNGTKYMCLNCHQSVSGGDTRNPFGQTVEDNLTNGNVRWDLIFNIDSDGDGYTNGQELQDPEGLWATGQPNPGDKNLVTKEWDPNSNPGTSNVEDLTQQSEAIVFPTLTDGVVSLKFMSNLSANSLLEIYELKGHKVYSSSIITNVGENNLKINMRDYAQGNGIYFIVVRNKYFLIKKKFVLSR
jgi:hypothetical protein